MWHSGFRSIDFSSLHGANSFIHIFFFMPIVKDELAVLQQRAAAPKAGETRIA
jgi:hypothetical protein